MKSKPLFQNGRLKIRALGRLRGVCSFGCIALLLLPFCESDAADVSPVDPARSQAQPAFAAKDAVYPLAAFAAIGSSFAQSSRLPDLGWDEAQIDAFVAGVRAAMHGKGYPFDENASKVSAEMGRRVHEIEERGKKQAAETVAQPARLQQYMKETRKRLRLQQTDSGLGYRIDPGRGGLRPRPNDTVVFACIATAADATTNLPQLSSERVRAKMTDLVPGLLEGLQMMTLESKAIFMLPPALSFGDREWPPGVNRGTPLIFQITLHEVIPAETTP